MSTISIGDAERDLRGADPHWVNEQIRRRQVAGGSPCVRIRVQADGIDIVLMTASCARSGPGGRPPNARERELFDLWDQMRLNETQFDSGWIVAFLQRSGLR